MATQEQATNQVTKSLRREGELVLGHIRDAQTVLNVANEAWSDKHESFVGILDLLDHKLAMIESVVETAGVAMADKQPALSSVD